MPCRLRAGFAWVVWGCLAAWGVTGDVPNTVAAETEANWTGFRGPRGDGSTPARNLPTTWSETKNVAWKTEIHGKGWSSPVVWGDRVWLTTATTDGKKLSTLCLDRATGKFIHDRVTFEVENPRFCHPTNSYASCTPVIEEGRLYVHFGAYGTACIDTGTGEKLWERRDFVCDDYRGPASSPILYGNLLIAHFDGYDVQFVAAMDKTTGKTVWRTDRRLTYTTDNGDIKKAYATPAVLNLNGSEQLVSPSAQATQGLDPLTGEVLWIFNHGGMNTSIRPLLRDGVVYLTTGDGPTKLVAIRPAGKGDITKTAQVWADNKGAPKRPVPTLVGDKLIVVGDDGITSCRQADTGAILWRERLPGAYWASPLLAGDKIYFFSQEGKTTVASAVADKFEQLGEGQLDKGCNASPAVVGDAIYLRTFTHLYRLETKD